MIGTNDPSILQMMYCRPLFFFFFIIPYRTILVFIRYVVPLITKQCETYCDISIIQVDILRENIVDS